jgi:hypothetical protein
MPDHQRRSDSYSSIPVKGYAPVQSARNIRIVNGFKEVEESILRAAEAIREDPGSDNDQKRAANVAITYLQTGFMWLNRAVFNPGRISLPTDPNGDDDVPESSPPGGIDSAA